MVHFTTKALQPSRKVVDDHRDDETSLMITDDEISEDTEMTPTAPLGAGFGLLWLILFEITLEIDMSLIAEFLL